MQTFLIVSSVVIVALVLFLAWRALRRPKDWAASVLKKVKSEKLKSYTHSERFGYPNLAFETVALEIKGSILAGNFEIVAWPLEDGQIIESQGLQFVYRNHRPEAGLQSQEDLQTEVRRILISAQDPVACRPELMT